jgi:hypothetical protein
MPRRKLDRSTLRNVASTDSNSARFRTTVGETRDRRARKQPATEIVPDHGDQQEAWAIAAELITDLGAHDAVAWADNYMRDLHRKRDWRGMQRWGIVGSALDELVSANVH